jgi:diketogulonate reductase-like aldo/keto reductase
MTESSVAIPTYTLNNGIVTPLVGFGTFAKGRTAGLSYNAIIAALDAGYRHLDCAWL